MQVVAVLVVLAVLVIAVNSIPRPFAHAVKAQTISSAWSTFLRDNKRDSYNGAETIINPTSAANLKVNWIHTPAVTTASISSEPILADGLIYWGSWDGVEHASDPTTGKDVWTSSNLGTVQKCQQGMPHGVMSSGTVASIPINGTSTSVLFVAGGNAQLVAFNALTGAVIWQTVLGATPQHFIYSSPLVYQGNVYIGMSSYDDCPLVQGQMIQLNAATGVVQHTFNTVPNGCLGGSVWGSPALDTSAGLIYFSTGNEGSCSTTETLTDAVIALHISDLSLADSWQIPPSQTQQTDSDFGSTPTLFHATIKGTLHMMLGLINKNGVYYAFDRTKLSSGPLWQVQVAVAGNSPDHGAGSISSSSWDGTTLYVAGSVTTINGVSCGGSVQALVPATGAAIWQDCFQKNILAPVVTVPGLVIIGGGHSMYVLDAKAGARLFTYTDNATSSRFWGAASVSNGLLYVGNVDGNLYSFCVTGVNGC